MGAWGSGPFENDDACDWLDELADSGVAALRAALALADDAEYLEAPDGSVIVAAAEVVAQMGVDTDDDDDDDDDDDAPDELVAFLADCGPPPPALVAAARAALDRVTADESELRELWQDAEGGAWQAAIDDLKRRLAQR